MIESGIFRELRLFIRENYVDPHPKRKYSFSRRDEVGGSMADIDVENWASIPQASMPFFADEGPGIPGIDEEYDSFAKTLFDFIDDKGITDGEACRRSGIDRRVLSKIRTSDRYTPTKRTIFSFAVGLRLTEEETSTLLMKAGYAFTDTSKLDLIIQFFLRKGIYDIWEINEALDYYDQAPICC